MSTGHVKLKCHAFLGSLSNMWESGFTAEKPVEVGLLLAEQFRCFYYRMLKATYSVVSESLRLHKAKLFNRCQEPLYLGPPWQDLPRARVASSASLSPPPTSVRERGEFIGRTKIYSMESYQCAVYFNIPYSLPGKGTIVLSSFGKMSKFGNRGPQRTLKSTSR